MLTDPTRISSPLPGASSRSTTSARPRAPRTARMGSRSAVGPAEIDRQLDPGDVPRLVRGQPSDGRRDVLGLAHRVGENPLEQRPDLRVTVEKLAQAGLELGVDAVRVDGV